MHMTLLAGGPEPGDGGRLNVIRYVFYRSLIQFQP